MLRHRTTVLSVKASLGTKIYSAQKCGAMQFLPQNAQPHSTRARLGAYSAFSYPITLLTRKAPGWGKVMGR